MIFIFNKAKNADLEALRRGRRKSKYDYQNGSAAELELFLSHS